MKKNSFASALFPMLLLVSCAVDPMKQSESISDAGTNLVPVTVTATIDPQTKTNLAANGHSVTWEAGDQIALVPFSYSNCYILSIVPADAGKKTARFTGYILPTTYTYNAVYPASAVVSTAYRDYLVLNLPSVQTYRAGSFSQGANVAACITNTPNETLSFENIGGLLKLTLKGSDVSISKIELVSGNVSEFLAGTAFISREDMTKSGTNFINEQTRLSTLTLDCGSGTALSPGGTDFYFFVPFDKLASGFTVRAYDTDGKMMVVKAPASEQNRIIKSDIKAMPPIDYVGNIPVAFVSKTVPGIYSLSLNPTPESLFVTSSLQSGAVPDGNDQIFTVKNWDEKYVVGYRMPKSLVSMQTYDIPVSDLEGSSGMSSQTLHLKFVLSDNGLGWFVDETSNKGYIFNVVQ